MKSRYCNILSIQGTLLLLILSAGIGWGGNLQAQSGLCDAAVPFHVVDLSAQVNSSFVTPQDRRDGNCCGTTSPDRCVEFEVTLHPNALGISFDIYSGAVPTGAMFYQINCGPPVPVGQAVCLSGVGPHTVTFCKPGNNPNAYIVRSIPPPYSAPDNEVRIGCTIELETSGLIPATISWTDVTSGTGAFDSLLSCLTGCTTTYFQPAPGTPAFVDYEVCGSIFDTICNSTFSICDTLRVFVYPELEVPDLDTVYYCITDGGATLQGGAYGGFGSYEYYWFDGAGNLLGNGSSYFATTPGVYQLEIRDELYPACPADLQDIQVLPDQPATVNAGTDTLICSANPSVQLNGWQQYSTGAIWSGGAGTYNLPNDSLQNSYLPTSGEVAAQSVILTLTSKADTACPVSTDQKVIQFRQPPVLAITDAADLTCYQSADGFINVNTTGGTAPYGFAWNDGSITEDLSDLDSGSYQLIVTDALGCSDTINQVISQPTALLAAIGASDVSCFGGANGTLSTVVSGGSPGYSYSWNNGESSANQNGLAAGTYSVTVTDANGCSVGLDTVVVEPAPLAVGISNLQNVTCYGLNNGQISLSVSGGAGGYSFAWSNAANTPNISGLTPGTYAVSVTDVNGCMQVIDTTITEPAPLQSGITAAYVTCHGSSNGLLTLNPTGGTPPYAYNWSNSAVTQNLNGIPAGTYTVTITDANGCNSVNTRVILQPDSITISATTANTTCYGATDASINLSVSGGVLPYSYQWNDGPTVQNRNAIPSGNYSVTITDGNGCVKILPVVLTQPPAIILSFTTTPASCNGGMDGTIDLNVSGGQGPYTYRWTNGQTTQDRSNIAAGNYAVTVTDANGCNNDTVVIVNEPNSILLNATVTSHVTCFGGSNGAIDLTASGGSGSYTYNWSTSANTQDVAGLTAGTYFVTVNDVNNCVSIISAVINQPQALIGSTNATDISCRDANDGAIDLTISGGLAPYTFNWSDGATNEDISNLAEGAFRVTVTDANGCTLLLSDTIINPDSINVQEFISHVTCFGGSNGFLEAIPSGGFSPYRYLWSDSTTLPFLFSRSAGTYGLTVTDARGCTKNYQYTVTQPDSIILQSSFNNITCNAGADGNILLNPVGGTPGYTYNWSNGGNTQNIAGITAGNYGVTVTDANNCTQTGRYVLTQPDSVRLQASTTNINCSGNTTGAIDITVSGGVPPYNYLWNTTATSQDLHHLAAGTYTVTVTDSRGCIHSLTRDITEPQPLTISITKEDILCFGSANGTVNAIVSGGTQPYAYQWNNSQATATILNQPAGTYAVTVTDARGCSVTGQATITQPSQMTVSGTVSNVSCYQANDGAIDVTAAGGTPPYTYAWLDGPLSQNRTALAAGDYYLTVTDANGCEVFYNASVTQPTDIRITDVVEDASCNGTPDGQIDINVSGGVPGYTYSWSTNVTTQNLANIPAAAYQVTVTDATGCQAERTIIVNEPSSLTIDAQPSQQVSCHGGNDGAINLTINGLIGISQISWSNGSNNQNIGLLVAGDYFVTVTDVNGCRIIDAATITEPDPLDVIPDIKDVTCFGRNDGLVTTMVSGGTMPYQYSWSNPNTGPANYNLAAGAYSLVVLDSVGCSTTLNYTISEPDSLTAEAISLNHVSCYGLNDGAAEVNYTGGTAPYSILWSNNATDSVANALAVGTYWVSVTDSAGCFDTSTVTISQPDSINPTLNIHPVSCNDGTDGAITVAVTGGTPSYSYQWDNLDTMPATSGLSAGTYAVTITDANNCTRTANAFVPEPDTIMHQFTVQNTSCFGSMDGSVYLQMAGGSPPYTYSWSNNAVDSSLQGIPAGNYTVSVTDAGGCLYVADTTITQPNSMLLTVVVSNITCFGAANGSVSISAMGGSGPYSYRWSNNATTPTLSNLGPGVYQYTVTDAAGCAVVGSTNAIEPGTLTVSTSGTEWICQNRNNGSISATVLGGTPPYVYSWNNNSTSPALTGLVPGSYTVTITDNNACQTSTSFTIQEIVNQLNLSTTVACVFDTISFTGTSSADSVITRWQWHFGDGGISNAQNTAHSYSSSGLQNVTLIIETSAGCTDTLTGQVQVNQLPTANAGADAAICLGDTALLTASGGVSYAWLGSPSLASPSSASTLAYPSVDETFVVTVTDGNGCTNQDSVLVQVNLAPVFNLGADTAICPGDTMVLHAANGASYHWTSTDPSLSCTTCPSPTISPRQDEEYAATITNAMGCSTSDTIRVNQLPLPGGITVNSNILCQYDEVRLSGPMGQPGQYTYSWLPAQEFADPTKQIVTVQIDTGKMYSLTTTNVYGCSFTDTAQLVINPVPRNFLADTLTICQSDTAQITAPQGLQHLWQNVGSISCLQCADPLVYPAQTTAYPVISSTIDGCVTRDTVHVIVNNRPNIALGIGSGFCPGTPFTIQAPALADVAYLWSPAQGLDDPTAIQPQATLTADQTYHVVVTDSNGCTDTDSITYLATKQLALAMATDTAICEGEKITLWANTLLNLSGSTQFTWFDETGTQLATGDSVQIKPNGAQEYTVVLESTGCLPDTGYVRVGLHALPEVSIEHPDVNYEHDTVLLVATPNSNFTYQWSVPRDTLCNSCNTLQVIALNTAPYSVTVTDENGCVADTTTLVRVFTLCQQQVYIPNSFSPNRDGQNDVFKIRALVPVNVETFRIFDRWGNLVFEGGPDNQEWDGLYRDRRMVDPGVYVYYVKAVCSNGEALLMKGNVTLLK